MLDPGSFGPTDPRSTYTYGDCTYGMALLFPDLPPYLGDASQWIDKAKAQGLTVLSKPTMGTIVSYSAGGKYSKFGHVALVERVNDNNTFVVKEMNFNAWNTWDERTSDMENVQGFIVPPGSTNIVLESATHAACHTFSWSVFGSEVCFDGAVAVGAIVVGSAIAVTGVVLLFMYTMRTFTGINVTPGGGGTRARGSQQTAPSSTPNPQQASSARVQKARERAIAKATSPKAIKAETERERTTDTELETRLSARRKR